jgi:hypothetical protein
MPWGQTTAPGLNLPEKVTGKSTAALRRVSRRSQGVVDLAEAAYGANRSACGRATVGSLASSPCGRRSESPSSGASNVANLLGSRRCWQPTAPSGAAYCRVVRNRSDPPRPGNRSSRLATAAAQIRIERLPRLLGQFEPHRPTGFPLAHVGAVDCLAMRRHVINAFSFLLARSVSGYFDRCLCAPF